MRGGNEGETRGVLRSNRHHRTGGVQGGRGQDIGAGGLDIGARGLEIGTRRVG